MNRIKIQKVSLEDIAAIVRIHKTCVRVINVKAYSKFAISVWLKQISVKNVIKQLYNSKWIVLKRNNQIIGFAQYSIADKILYQINITPHYVGKGFGKIIYGYIEKEFLKNKIKAIELNATLNAVPFYKKLGFKSVKNIVFKLNSVSIKMTKMRKRFMPKLFLRKIKTSDKEYFAEWWRDTDLLKLTSGFLDSISDKEVNEYFSAIYKSTSASEFIIILGARIIGHISLVKRRNGWYETQIVIGEKRFWNKGYGTKAILLLMQKAKRLGISKVYLEVRPNNLRVIRAYENCGFIKTRTKKYPKNKHLPETIRMEKNTEVPTSE